MANPNHPHEFYLIVPEGVTISIASLRSYGDPEGGEFLNPESLKLPMSRIPQGTKVLIAQGVDV
jgi:hypothetical protein